MNDECVISSNDVSNVISHTRTVMRESAVRATTQVNGKTGNSTPCHPRTP